MNEHDKSAMRQILLVIIGFTAVVLILLAATMVSLSHLSHQHEHLTLLQQQSMQSELMHTIRLAIRERMLNLSNLANFRDASAIEPEWEKYKANTETLLATREALVNIDTAALETRIFSEQGGFKQYNHEFISSVAELMQNEKYAEASAQISLAQMAHKHMDAVLADLLKTGQSHNQQTIIDAGKSYTTTRSYIFLLDVLAIILSLSIITFVVRSISDTQETLSSTLNALEAANEYLEERVFDRTRDLIDARDAALEANKAKSRFLANMSHELRTPLNAIIGYSEILIEDAEDLGYEEQLEDLNKIQSSGKHLLNLVSDILEISKIEAGKVQILPERFNLLDLLQETINIIKVLIEKQKNTFEFHYDERITEMYSDPIRIRQIMLNLLNNAAKFTNEGVVTLRVEQEMRAHKQWIIFIVKDTGIGISRKQQDKLFQAFVQIDNSATRKYDGSGLGLAITQRFCQLMGGSIVVDSELGNGSQFMVKLPLSVL